MSVESPQPVPFTRQERCVGSRTAVLGERPLRFTCSFCGRYIKTHLDGTLWDHAPVHVITYHERSS